jgi:hypothetical protein
MCQSLLSHRNSSGAVAVAALLAVLPVSSAIMQRVSGFGRIGCAQPIHTTPTRFSVSGDVSRISFILLNDFLNDNEIGLSSACRRDKMFNVIGFYF